MILDTEKLQKEVIQNKVRHGFNTTDVKFELLLLYGEVNELFQAWLKDDSENIGEELADVAIFLLGISEMLGKDLGEEITKKMKINKDRVYVNGKKLRSWGGIYVQVKRYDEGNTVGRQTISQFHGDLDLQGADTGVFITTSSFTNSAEEAARTFNIKLIDGDTLTKLMIDYKVGVQVMQNYELLEIDDEFFEID